MMFRLFNDQFVELHTQCPYPCPLLACYSSPHFPTVSFPDVDSVIPGRNKIGILVFHFLNFVVRKDCSGNITYLCRFTFGVTCATFFVVVCLFVYLLLFFGGGYFLP